MLFHRLTRPLTFHRMLVAISLIASLNVVSTAVSAEITADAASTHKDDAKAESSSDFAASEPHFKTTKLHGRVVFLGDALKRRFGITVMPDAVNRILAVESKAGKLTPLVEDLRGRAFRTDERLRRMDLELLARQYEDVPFVQVIQVYEVTGQDKFAVDYWCDICSIVMYEMGSCACCQDDNRLRKRKVESE